MYLQMYIQRHEYIRHHRSAFIYFIYALKVYIYMLVKTNWLRGRVLLRKWRNWQAHEVLFNVYLALSGCTQDEGVLSARIEIKPQGLWTGWSGKAERVTFKPRFEWQGVNRAFQGERITSWMAPGREPVACLKSRKFGQSAEYWATGGYVCAEIYFVVDAGWWVLGVPCFFSLCMFENFHLKKDIYAWFTFHNSVHIVITCLFRLLVYVLASSPCHSTKRCLLSGNCRRLPQYECASVYLDMMGT